MVFNHSKKKVADSSRDEAQGFMLLGNASHRFHRPRPLLVGSRQDKMKTTESSGPGSQPSVFSSIKWGCCKAPSDRYGQEGQVMSGHGHSGPSLLAHLGWLGDSKHHRKNLEMHEARLGSLCAPDTYSHPLSSHQVSGPALIPLSCPPASLQSLLLPVPVSEHPTSREFPVLGEQRSRSSATFYCRSF